MIFSNNSTEMKRNIPETVCRSLFLLLIPSTALVVWHGNLTAIEIKDFVVQVITLTVLGIIGIRISFLDKIFIRKDPLLGLAAVYGLIMILGYLLST